MFKIHEIKTLFYIFIRQYSLKYIYTLIISIFVLSYFSVMISIPSITNFAEIGPFESAEYDIFITGTLDNVLLKEMETLAINGDIVKGSHFGGIEVFKKDSFIGRADFIMVDEVEKALELTELNSKYIKRGKVSQGAILDEFTAKKLRIKIGDKIKIKIKDEFAEFEIVAILFPTTPSRSLILAFYPDNIKKMFSPSPYFSVWLKVNKDKMFSCMAKLSDDKKNGLFLTTREDLIQRRKAGLEGLSSNWTYALLKYGSFIVFTILMLRDIFLIFNKRQKDYALLLGLGFSREILSFHLVIEQLLKLLSMSFIASFGAKLFIENVINLYYPLEAFLSSISYLIIIAFFVTVITAFIAFNRIKRIPIAKLLSEIEV